MAVKFLLNEHATHKYEMKKHLKTFIYDVKKRSKKADVAAKLFSVINSANALTSHMLTSKSLFTLCIKVSSG